MSAHNTAGSEKFNCMCYQPRFSTSVISLSALGMKTCKRSISALTHRMLPLKVYILILSSPNTFPFLYPCSSPLSSPSNHQALPQVALGPACLKCDRHNPI
ncbi:hypothetical protein AMECASPLE_017060 [Ameca splendens]|uniref:Uncharacterized protein n=1 Tax=Ameca splendens TaxID=208324 RepID=A0ABV1A8R8_9TELE